MTDSRNKIHRLGIGTAQFGMDYGISNPDGKTAPDEVAAILEYAAKVGIRFIDTAPAYGEAERVLGRKIPVGHDFRIITKVSPTVENPSDSIRRSLEALNADRLYGALFHGSTGLLSSSGDKLWEQLSDCRKNGLLEKIGVSIYDPEEAELLMDRYDVDVFQIPVNILDQRFIRSGTLKKMKSSGIEVHSRSCFLQGLLLMDPSSLPLYFSPAISSLRRIRQASTELGFSPLEIALNFVFSIEGIDRVVVGINSLIQLMEIVEALNSEIGLIEELSGCAVEDPEMINPSKWPREGSAGRR